MMLYTEIYLQINSQQQKDCFYFTSKAEVFKFVTNILFNSA